MSHTISRLGQAFRPLSCPPPYSLGTALTGVGVVASLLLGGVAGVCAVSFFVSAATSKKLKTNVPKHEKLFTVASSKRESVKRDLPQKLSLTAMRQMTNFA